MKHKLSVVLGCCGIIIGLVLLIQTQKEAEEEQPVLRVMLILKSPSSDVTKNIKAGVETASFEYDSIEIIEKYSHSDDDSERQNSYLEEAIRESYDLVIISTIDEHVSRPVIQKVRQQAITVITIDNDSQAKNGDIFIGSKPKEVGELMSTAILAMETSWQEVVLLTPLRATPNRHEIQASMNATLEKNQFKGKVQDISIGQTTDDATVEINEVLAAYPTTTTLVTFSDSATTAALQALRDKKLTGVVRLIAIARSKESIIALEEGEIDFLIAENPFAMGYQAVSSSYQLFTHNPIEKQVYTETKLINRNNLFEEDISRFLFSIE